MTENKQRRSRRTKASIVASIEQAACDEIAANGFTASLVTNIIKKANIEPQVFYNRYKDINDFYDAFVRKYDYCLNDTLEAVHHPIVSKEGLTSLLKAIMHTVNEDPIALELVRWEVCNKNKTTKRTSTLRELNFQPLIQGFTRSFKGSDVDITGIISLIVGGVYYLLMRKRLSPFYGIDLNTDDGVERVGSVIEYLVALVFDAVNYDRREAEIIERLRACGVREDIIAKAMQRGHTLPEAPQAASPSERPSVSSASM